MLYKSKPQKDAQQDATQEQNRYESIGERKNLSAIARKCGMK